MAMKEEKLKSVFSLYSETVRREWPRAVPEEMAEEDKLEPLANLFSQKLGNHLLFMCGKAAEFVDEGRREKAMRWLGFLQGVFCCLGIFSIDELKHHSMPDPEPAT